jgi:hypothetical protein
MTEEQQEYLFYPELSGHGRNRDEAWQHAVDCLCLEPGDAPEEVEEVEEGPPVLRPGGKIFNALKNLLLAFKTLEGGFNRRTAAKIGLDKQYKNNTQFRELLFQQAEEAIAAAENLKPDFGNSPDTDFVLEKGSRSCWISIDGFAVYLRRDPEDDDPDSPTSLHIEVFANGYSGYDSLGDLDIEHAQLQSFLWSRELEEEA